MEATKKKTAKKTAAKPYVIVRGYKAGVHCGKLTRITNKWIYLDGARRIWHWEGAASLSEIAVYGCSKPSECKICAPVSIRIKNNDEISEIIRCTAEGEAFLRGVHVWRA